MNIAILNWRDRFHADSGGAELIVHELAREWAEAGHSVTIYSSKGPGLRAEDADGPVRVRRVGSLRTATHHLQAPRAIMADGGVDVVLESINTAPYMLPLRRHAFPPFVPLVHQLAIDVWNAHLPEVIAAAAIRLERQFYRPYRAVSMVAYSDSTRSDLREVGIRHVDVLPQGGEGAQPIGEKADVPTFVFAARLAANKRPQDAVAAFRYIKRELPDARLLILGDGDMREALAAQLPDGATLMGKVPHAEALALMGRAHMLIATSVREGWGLVVTEANSVGTPAVTYDVGGLRDSVRDEVTGVLTEPTPQALARAVLELWSQPGRYEALRSNAIAWGSACTWKRMADAVMSHLEAAGAREAGIDSSPWDGSALRMAERMEER